MTCFGIEKAYQHPDVRIGWYPFVSVRETEIRTHPNGGYLLKRLIKGGGIGVQSVRNPVGINPPRRLPVEGWVWCYSRADGTTGWINEEDITVDPLSHEKPALRGPGGFDFEVGRTQPLPKKPNGCGRPSKTKPYRCVSAKTASLRYSGRGTAFHYLHKNDKVKLLIVDAPAGHALAEVKALADGRTVPRVGSRGWISQSTLSPLP